MTILTKEYFDGRLGGVDERLDGIDKHFESVARRFEAVDQRFDALERTIHDEIHDLAVVISKGFADLEKRLDVRERVEKLEKKMTKVESALNVQL